MNDDRCKFRGRLCHNNEWVYGNLIIANSGQPYILPHDIIQPDGHHLIIDSDNAFWVKPETIGQCTGLKDKNGMLGYHKDRYINEFGVECIIEWDKDKWVGKNETGIIYNIASWFDKCKIIGNIHEKESK